MNEFEEAKKNFMAARTHHTATAEKLNEMLKTKDKPRHNLDLRLYNRTVRELTEESTASEEILTQARRKFARAIKSEIETQPDFKAIREQIGKAYWARVIAGIHMEWNQLVDEYFKHPGNDELRRIKAEFVEKYNL